MAAIMLLIGDHSHASAFAPELARRHVQQPAKLRHHTAAQLRRMAAAD
jgi:hypothetical protein